MDAEMEALEKNKTWEMGDLPTGKNLVGCKRVYTVKYRVDGTLERYKVRLVAKWYTQTYDMDYLWTFSFVNKMNTVKILLLLVANCNRDLQQFDVKNAFLNEDLERNLYGSPSWIWQ